MRSPQTIGDELPPPGTGTFQAMFWVADQVSGYPVPLASPCPDGPRQRGQYFAPSPSSATILTPSPGAWLASFDADPVVSEIAMTMSARQRSCVIPSFVGQSRREMTPCERRSVLLRSPAS